MSRVKRNIEIKARCADLKAARAAALDVGAKLLVIERQHDTFFNAPNGRLKLRRRQIEASPADNEQSPRRANELIWYQRPDTPDSHGSDYTLVPVADAEATSAIMAAVLGQTLDVHKHRTVYLHDNVRIHLDDVVGLGTFIEFEAHVDETCDDAAARDKLDRLRGAFGIKDEDLVAGAYADRLNDL